MSIRLLPPRSLDLRKPNGELVTLADAEILIGRLRPSYQADSIRVIVATVHQRSAGQQSLPLGTVTVLAKDSTIRMTVIMANRPAVHLGIVVAASLLVGVVIGTWLYLRAMSGGT